MSLCNFLPILIALGGLFFGGLTTWAFFRIRLNKLVDKCQTAETDNFMLWNSYTSLQNEFSQFKKEFAVTNGAPRKKSFQSSTIPSEISEQ